MLKINQNSSIKIPALGNSKLVHSVEDYFLRLLAIITNAKTEIHLQTYIFEEDKTGKEIAAELIKSANRKVKVYILLDGYGSQNLSSTFIEDLTKNGINIRLFSPFFSKNNFHIGRRLHHKIVVAGGKIVLTGGVNIADKYRGSETRIPWLDYSVQIENQTFCKPFQELCLNIYWKKIGNITQPICTTYNETIKILQNDWLNQKSEICNAYSQAIYNAKNEITIVASYFLPSKRLRNVIKIAARKNVKVKIVLSSLSDLPVVMWATKYLYGLLLKQGIELYEWKKSVLHAKIGVVEKYWATVGSFNLNHLSSNGSIEMNVATQPFCFGKNLSNHLNDIISQCDKITFETLESRNGIFRRFRNFVSYYFVRVALIICTYIPRKRFLKFY